MMCVPDTILAAVLCIYIYLCFMVIHCVFLYLLYFDTWTEKPCLWSSKQNKWWWWWWWWWCIFVRHFWLPLVKIRVIFGCSGTYESPSHVRAFTARARTRAPRLHENSHRFAPAGHLLAPTRYCRKCHNLQPAPPPTISIRQYTNNNQ